MGKFNELTKSMLMEEIVLPESNEPGVFCYLFVLLWNIPFAAWMCDSFSSVSFPLDGFPVPRQVTWNQLIVLEHSDDV